MNQCPRCGTSHAPLDRFCPACGTGLVEQASRPDDGFSQQILQTAQTDGLIAAIKLYREQKGCGLKEAKEEVEQLLVQNGVASPRAGCLGMLLGLAALVWTWGRWT